MQPQQPISPTQKLDQSISTIKQKMKLVNYNNFQPPYLLHTLTKFRESNLGRFLKEIKVDGEHKEKDEEVRSKLKTVHYIIEKFDDESFDFYAEQIREPYIRRMFQDNYQFDNIEFKEVNAQYGLNAEIHQTLTQAAQWLTQIQVTQDLLSRTQLYFKVKTPHILQRIREDGLKGQGNTWSGALASNVKKLLSFGLRKGSKMIQTTFFTAVAPGALMLTLAIIGGTSTIPWKSSVDLKSLITAAAIATVPFLLDSMAKQVQKSDYQVKLRRWAQTFAMLADNIRKFNQKLEENIRNCTICGNLNQYVIQRTNLQKIIRQLTIRIDSVTKFDQQKFQQMRDRTQAYYKEYIQTMQDGWLVVTTKQQHENMEKYKEQSNQKAKQSRKTRQTNSSQNSSQNISNKIQSKQSRQQYTIL